MTMTSPVLVELWRHAGELDGPGQGALESAHRGALMVVDAHGHTVLALGEVDRLVFGRSAVKGLQALPLVASGAAEAAAMTDAELALACASHNGEAGHATTAAGLLKRLGLDETVLECGAHEPKHGPSAAELIRAATPFNALHNNCSGKHSGFVCLGCLLARQAGVEPRRFLQGYVEPGHVVMREVSAAVSAATGVDVERQPRGRDGCSIPTHALPLRALALGFARFGTGQGLSPGHAAAAARLRRAVASSPWHVAGSGRFDTRVMQALGERVFCKVGAEAVYCAALPERGWGVAIKMEDGNTARAVEVVMAAVIQVALGLEEGGNAAADLIASLVDQAQTNWRGRPVGRLAATAGLRQALAPLRPRMD